MANLYENNDAEGSSASALNYKEMSTDIDFNQVLNSINSLNIPEEDKQMLNRYLSTIIQYTQNPKTRALAYECLQFIFRQLNPDTFISEINELKYRLYLESSGFSLFRMVNLKYMDDENNIYAEGVDFNTRSALFHSTFNFMDLLFNRILYGRDKKYNEEMARAKNPPKIQTG
jgi:hypothetical protein